MDNTIIPFQDDHSLPAEVSEALFNTLTEEQDPNDYIIKQYQDENLMWCYKLELKPTEPTGN
uniref:hypothetical protein n=1 Tax=Shewanella sp. TaxID=50422 RepID=UPI00404813A0